MHEHGEWVQAQGEAANWGRKEGRVVRFRTSTADLSLVSSFSAHNVDSHADHTLVDDLSIFVLAHHVDPERISILMELPLLVLGELPSNLVLVVGLRESDGLFGESTVFKQLSEVKLLAADDVVALEEVSIKHLHSESVVADYLFVKEKVFGIDEAIVPTSLLTWLQSVVSVCFQRVFAGVEEAAHEHITAVFYVHHLYVFSVQDGDTEFEFFWRLRFHVVNGLDLTFRYFSGVNF